jgi:hypothetical protein
MKDNVLKNIIIDSGEKVYKDFPKLKGKDYLIQIVLTTKRLIFYTYGNFINKGKKIRKRGMNEIELKSITHVEYYVEYIRHALWVRLLGFILAIGSIGLAYAIYASLVAIPAYPYSGILNYVGAGLILLVALIMMFKVSKTLYFQVKSGLNDTTRIKLHATKYNELTMKYLASKMY